MTFFVFFAVLAAFNPLELRIAWLTAAICFAASALFLPAALKPLNFLWFYFGQALHKVTNPVILGVLFFLVITPIAFLTRLLGKNILSLSFDKKHDSYWIRRETGETSMKHQF
ncbi:MAG: SxtJ family membrane protein [Helicobacteraceae bacterium]|nr:SxtJ family membrane protein [Helicobacteraceae bacterium]